MGRLPALQHLPELEAAPFQVILSLCSEQEGSLPPEIMQAFDCRRVVLADSRYAEPMSLTDFTQAVASVHECVRQGQSIYVHCLLGIQRSPLVCIGYLCCYRNLTVIEALQWLKQVHPSTYPTAEQIQLIKQFLDEFSHSRLE